MGLETTPLPDFMDLYVFQESQVKARIGWQSLTTREYLKSGKYGLVGGINLVDGKIDWDSIPYVSKWRYDQDKFIQLQQNDVLISKDGTIGKIAFVDSLPFPSTLNSGVYVVRPKEGKYDPSFMYHLLNSFVFEDFIEKLSAGSTISHLYQKDLKHFLVQIPSSLDAQKAIAEALGDIDGLIRNLQANLTKKTLIFEGSKHELLSGKKRLPGHKSEWKLTKVSDIVTVDWGNTNLTKASYRDGGQYLAVSATGVDGLIDHYEHEAYVPVISAIGALCGKMMLPKSRFVAIKNTITLTPFKDVSDGAFIFHLFNYQQLPIRGGAQPFISKGDVEKFEILCPSGSPDSYDEQRKIGKVLEDMTIEIEEIRKSIDKYEFLKQGMMNDLLTGKVRLV